MFVRRLLVCFLTLLLMLPCIAYGENVDDGTYYTIEFEYTDEYGELRRGVAFERLDMQVIKDLNGTNIWFQWMPNDAAFGYDIPEYVQIFFWVPDGVGSAQYPVINPVTGENLHAMAGTELAPLSLLVRLPEGDEYRQFVLSPNGPDANWLSGLNDAQSNGYDLQDGYDGQDDGYNGQGDGYFDLNNLNGLNEEPDNTYLENADNGNQGDLIYPDLEGSGGDDGRIDNGPANDLGNDQGNNIIPQQQQGVQRSSLGGVGIQAAVGLPAPTDGMGTLGTIYYDNTVLYVTADPSQGVVDTLPKDTVVRIADLVDGYNPQIIDGKYWYAVRVENNPQLTGYMMLDAFQLMTPEQEQAHIATYGQPQQVPPIQTKYANIKVSGAELRTAPSGMSVGTVSGDVVATYRPDVSMPSGYDSYNKLWVYVQLSDGREGFMRYDDVTFFSPEDQALYEKDEQKMPELPSGHASSGKNLNMMRDKDTLNEIDTVRQGEIGKYLGQSTLYKKDIWLLMDFAGKVGYVKYDDMNFLSQADADTYELSLKPDPKLPDNLTSSHVKITEKMTPILDPASKQPFSTLDVGQIGKIIRDDPVYSVEYIDKKELWVLTQFGNKKGYVKFDTASMEVLSAQAEKDYLTTDQELYPVESYYAHPNASNTQVLDVSSKNPIKLLNPKDYVQYLPLRANNKYIDPKDTDRKLWLLVEYEPGMVGYIKLDTITFLTAAQEKELKATPTPGPNPTLTAAPVTAVPVTQKPTAPQVSGLMKTNAQLTVLYYWYNVGLPKAGLSRGTVVYVQEQLYDEANQPWAFVQYETPTGTIDGYIQSSYLTSMTSAEQQAYYTNRTTAKPSALPTYSPYSFSGYLLITKNQVNFRTGPSTTSTMTQRLQYGTIVRAIGVENMNDGYTWYQCESAGQTGYVRGDNIRELTVQEYQSIVTSPSYQQGSNVITPVATAKPLSGIDYSSWPTQKPVPNATISFQTIPPMPTGTAFATLNPNVSAAISPSPSIDPFASPSAGATDFFGGLTSPSPDPFASIQPTTDPEFPTEKSNGSPTGLIMAGVVLALLGGGGLYGYSIYNKARRKQAQEQAQRLAAEARKKAQQAEKEIGGNAAVRRPIPPVVPGQTASGQQKPGQPGQPGQRPGQTTSGQPAPGQPLPGQRPGQPTAAGQPQPGQPLTNRPGTPTGRPGTQGQSIPPGINPYARPQTAQPTAQRTQEVASTMPRSQVDGKPIDGKPVEEKRVEGRPIEGTVPPQQGIPLAAPTVVTAPKAPAVHEGQGPGVQEQTAGAYAPPQPSLFARPPAEQKSRMPIAPAPVTAAPTSPTVDGQHDEDAQTPRKRRRRQEEPSRQENEPEE